MWRTRLTSALRVGARTPTAEELEAFKSSWFFFLPSYSCRTTTAHTNVIGTVHICLLSLNASSFSAAAVAAAAAAAAAASAGGKL